MRVGCANISPGSDANGQKLCVHRRHQVMNTLDELRMNTPSDILFECVAGSRANPNILARHARRGIRASPQAIPRRAGIFLSGHRLTVNAVWGFLDHSEQISSNHWTSKAGESRTASPPPKTRGTFAWYSGLGQTVDRSLTACDGRNANQMVGAHGLSYER